MAMIDPMMAPYMQQAFGGGELTERDLQQVMRNPQMGGGGILGGAGSQRGMGQIMQAPVHSMMPQQGGGGGGKGPNKDLIASLMAGGNPLGGLFGGSATKGGDGNWTPGPQGFGSASLGQRLGGLGGK